MFTHIYTHVPIRLQDTLSSRMEETAVAARSLSSGYGELRNGAHSTRESIKTLDDEIQSIRALLGARMGLKTT